MKLPERRKASRPYSSAPMSRVNSTVTTVISTTPAARIAKPAMLDVAMARLSLSPDQTGQPGPEQLPDAVPIMPGVPAAAPPRRAA